MANEYLSLQQFPGDGVTTDFTVNFAGGTGDDQQGTSPYINIADVKAYELIPSVGTAPSQRIPRVVEILGPLSFRIAPAVQEGRVLEISRETEDRHNLVDFKSLQAVSEFDLDLAVRQLLFVTQESSDRASLAFTGSEEANQTAAEALIVANDAFDQAGDASDVAGQALARSNTAINTANSATNTANNASDTADGAVVTANAANIAAGEALTTANSAESTANAASDTANAASTAAGQATNTANTALSTANTALTQSGTAIDTADNALLVAGDAFDVAEAAEIAAGDATDTANNAEQVALGIAGTAGDALTTANEAHGIATDAMAAVEEAGVASFNGRAGLVLPEAGDYEADMVSYGSGTVADELVDLGARVSSSTSMDDVQDWWTGTGNQDTLDSIDGSLQDIQNEFSQVAIRFNGIDADIDGITTDISGINTDIGGINTAIGDLEDFNDSLADPVQNAAILGRSSQLDAETGTDNIKIPTSLRVFQAIRSVAANATEGLRGTLRLATTEQAQELTAGDVAITPETLGDVLQGVGAPIGSVRWEMARSNIGDGYAACDGQILSRATYPDAWAAIDAGTVPVVSDAEWVANPDRRGSFSRGNGSTTFRMPDYNGQSAGSLGAVFLRGDGLKSGLPGRVQLDGFKEHQHLSGLKYVNAYMDVGAAYGSEIDSVLSSVGYHFQSSTAGAQGRPYVSPVGGAETRPLNVAGVWVVKLFGAVVNVGSADAAQLASDFANLAGTVGTKLDADKALGGAGQTWQDVTASRALNTTYTNTGGRPILMMINVAQGSAGRGKVVVAGVDLCENYQQGGGEMNVFTVVVPAGATYSYQITAGAQTLNRWVILQ